MSIVKRFITNLKNRPRNWKFAWTVTAVLCVYIAFKTTLLGNVIMFGCWSVWAWSIYGDWENK